MDKINDPVILEHNELLIEISQSVNEMPVVEVAKNLASHQAYFLQQFMLAKSKLAGLEQKNEKLSASEYSRLRWKDNISRSAKEATQELVLNSDIAKIRQAIASVETRIEFFEQALKLLNGFNFTLNGILKFYTANRDEL